MCFYIYVDAGYTGSDMRGAGYTALELMAVGFKVPALVECGYSIVDLKKAGFTAHELLVSITAVLNIKLSLFCSIYGY